MRLVLLAGLICAQLAIPVTQVRADLSPKTKEEIYRPELSPETEEEIYRQACSAYKTGTTSYINVSNWVTKQVEKNYVQSSDVLEIIYSVKNDPETKAFLKKQNDIDNAYMYLRITRSVMSRVSSNCSHFR